MVPFSIPYTIFLSVQPVDFRKSFDGLSGEVTNYLGMNPEDGSLFVFYNKRRDRIKMLLYEDDGFWLLYKRLEQGSFQFPTDHCSDTSYSLSQNQLHCILSGIDLHSVRFRKRYNKS